MCRVDERWVKRGRTAGWWMDGVVMGGGWVLGGRKVVMALSRHRIVDRRAMGDG